MISQLITASLLREHNWERKTGNLMRGKYSAPHISILYKTKGASYYKKYFMRSSLLMALYTARTDTT
ncbi:hypothetical protein OIU78_013389 [Salix suchowensis]|nr:hypothetical protein OIU78_013389 [Salix suchowensis]